MENNHLIEQEEELTISQELKRKWKILGKWALFFGILGLVVLALGLFYGLTMILLMNSMPHLDGAPRPKVGLVSAVLMFFLLGLGTLVFFIHLYHIRFATNIRIAMEQDQQTQFEAAWRYLRNHFRLFGMVIIAYLALLLGGISLLSYFFPV